MHKRACFIILQVVLVLGLAAFSPGYQGPQPDPGTPALPQTPVPTAEPTPDPGGDDGGSSGGVLTQIFQVVFSNKTLSEAMQAVFEEAAESEAERLESQTAVWSQILGEVLQAPSEGYYQAITTSSLYSAAAIAAPLFLLRLALYHWNKLTSENDSGTEVVGDWVAAGVLAVAAGPFLDLFASLSYWLLGAALGEAAQLGRAFIESVSVFDAVSGLAQVSLFSSVLMFGLALGGILAMGGMLFAFAAGQAVLYLLAVLAPILAVASVVPQMRWLRGLWFKAVALLGLMPIIGGAIFKASVSMSLWFSGGGILSILIRLLWLWGATGLLLSIAGILGRMTISASVGAAKQLLAGAKAVIGTAVLAGATGGVGAAAGGAGLAAGGGGAGGAAGVGGAGGLAAGPAGGGAGAAAWSGGSSVGSTSSAALAPALSHDQQALGHLQQAGALNEKAGGWDALGFRDAASFGRSQARGHELAARTHQLQDRIDRFDGGRGRPPSSTTAPSQSPPSSDYGFSGSVNAQIGSVWQGSPGSFQEGFENLAPIIENAGLEPQHVAEHYPEDTARMVQALGEMVQQDAVPRDLGEIASRAGATTFNADIYGNQG